uniref:Uncharacterized protein n=1 Tax=Oryza nivara TaxID=4536 RepID=A0A0E0GN68_ORYNI
MPEPPPVTRADIPGFSSIPAAGWMGGVRPYGGARAAGEADGDGSWGLGFGGAGERGEATENARMEGRSRQEACLSRPHC